MEGNEFSFVLLNYICQCQQQKILKVLPWKCNSEFFCVLLSYVCHCEQYKTCLGLHVWYLVFLSDCNQT
jgi:hypothetical protein